MVYPSAVVRQPQSVGAGADLSHVPAERFPELWLSPDGRPNPLKTHLVMGVVSPKLVVTEPRQDGEWRSNKSDGCDSWRGGDTSF